MQNKHWYVRFLLLSLLLGAVTLAPARAADTPTIAPQSCAAPGKLTMWVWDENWQKVIQQAVAAWSQKYCAGATVDVQLHAWDQYWDSLKTSAAGGDLPDVFNMSQDRFVFYANNNALLNLQPYFDKAGINTKVWGPGEIDPYRRGDQGDVYAGPVNWDTVAVLYNKDLFDAAKVGYPKADWTWDDFAKAAAALTNKDNDVYGASVYMEYQTGYSNWIASTGASPVVNAARNQCTLNDPGSLEALNFLKGLYDKGYMPSVSITGGSSADNVFDFFAAQKVAMITAGSWKLPDALSKLTFNWDIVRLPRNPKTGKSRSILHSVGYVASARTKNADLAANLIIYLISDEGQTFFAQAGGVAPANPSPALQKQWIDSFKTDKNVQVYAEATTDSQGVTMYDEIEDKVNTELVVDIFDQNQPVDQVVKSTCDFIMKNLPGSGTAK
jgi:multiple sugar transport system substrate-binding protein